MIRYNNSSQLLQKPVTTGGASAHWTLELGHRSTDVGWPGWSAPTVLRSRFGLQFLDLLYGFSPDIYITSVNIRFRYCLNILSTWVEQSHWFMSNTIISYGSHLITTQIRSGFYIYILEMSFCLMLYNIAMIQHYSRCIIRQLLWLRLTYPNAWFRLGFFCAPFKNQAQTDYYRERPTGACREPAKHIVREQPDNGLRHILPGPWGTGGQQCIKYSHVICIPRNVTLPPPHICLCRKMQNLISVITSDFLHRFTHNLTQWCIPP